jgi:hypothetical protein
VRHLPTGEVKLDHATAGGGGLLVSNAGRFVYFDTQGNGVPIAWTAFPTAAGHFSISWRSEENSHIVSLEVFLGIGGKEDNGSDTSDLTTFYRSERS